jgi:glycine dehydrogenase
LAYLKSGKKFWASVARVNNAAGDRNLICTCPPIEAYANSNGKGVKEDAEIGINN